MLPTAAGRCWTAALAMALAMALACCNSHVGAVSMPAPAPHPVYNPAPAGPVEPAAKIELNLDLPPEERWTAVCEKYRPYAKLVVEYFTSLLPPAAAELISKILGSLEKVFTNDYAMEMRGIAKVLGIDLGIVVGLNLSYELRMLGGPHPNVTAPTQAYSGPTACTSIVASNGSAVFHGRNLDWNLPESLRKLSVACDVTRGGKVVFKGLCVVGYTGMLTGMVPHRFSLSINERDLGGNPIVDSLNALLDGGKAVAHLAREVLETDGGLDFASAVTILEQRDVAAPVYYTVAGVGPDDGVVITRDRKVTADAWVLPNTFEGPDWFCLQTNYDHWKPDPPEDSRRTYGHHHMVALGQHNASTVDGLRTVLHTWPVGNNATCQTAIMIPAEGVFHAYVVHV